MSSPRLSPIYRKVTLLKLLGSSVVTNWRFSMPAEPVEFGVVPVEAGEVSEEVWHANAESCKTPNAKTLAGMSHTSPGSGCLAPSGVQLPDGAV